MTWSIVWWTVYAISSHPHREHTRAGLTHWGRVTHICVSKLTIIGSDNGLSPNRRQAIIWTNAGILLIGPLRTNFSEILIEIYVFSFKKIHLKLSSGIWLPFCLGLNVLKHREPYANICIVHQLLSSVTCIILAVWGSFLNTPCLVITLYVLWNPCTRHP